MRREPTGVDFAARRDAPERGSSSDGPLVMLSLESLSDEQRPCRVLIYSCVKVTRGGSRMGKEGGARARITVKVQPRAKATRAAGRMEGAYRLRPAPSI